MDLSRLDAQNLLFDGRLHEEGAFALEAAVYSVVGEVVDRFSQFHRNYSFYFKSIGKVYNKYVYQLETWSLRSEISIFLRS